MKIETGLEAAAGLVETCSTTALLLEVVVLAAGCIIGQARIGPQHRVVDAIGQCSSIRLTLAFAAALAAARVPNSPTKTLSTAEARSFPFAHLP